MAHDRVLMTPNWNNRLAGSNPGVASTYYDCLATWLILFFLELTIGVIDVKSTAKGSQETGFHLTVIVNTLILYANTKYVVLKKLYHLWCKVHSVWNAGIRFDSLLSRQQFLLFYWLQITLKKTWKIKLSSLFCLY